MKCPELGKSIGIEKRLKVALGLGVMKRVGRMIAKGYSFSFGGDKICSKIGCGYGYITL